VHPWSVARLNADGLMDDCSHRYLPALTPSNRSVYYNWGTDPDTNRTSPATRGSTCGTASFDLVATGGWGWNDTRCADPYVFMCRVRAPCTVRPPAYTAATGATFMYFPCNLTFSKAQVECNKVGGHLAGYTRWEALQCVQNPVMANGNSL
jgi:hypothetical protein